MRRAIVVFALLAVISSLPARAQDKRSVRSQDLKTGIQFGYAVVVGDEWAFVGEPDGRLLSDNAVYAYRKAGTDWVAADTLTSTNPGERFGASLALDGDRLFVGAPLSVDVGAVYVFELNDTETWTQTHLLQASSHVPGAGFGRAVDAYSDVVVVGAPDESGGRGAAYLYERQADGAWLQAEKMEGRTYGAYSFGRSVGVAGARAVVAAHRSDVGTGAVFSFEKLQGTWTMHQRVVAGAAQPSDYYGWTVASHGDRMIVGSVLADGSEGAAVVFRFNESSKAWSEAGVLTDPDPGGSYFGYDVSMTATHALIGSLYDHAVHMYALDESTQEFVLDGTLDDTASGTTLFGSNVSVQGMHAFVGARESERAVLFADSGVDWEQAAVFMGGTYSLPTIEGRVACEGGMAAGFPCENIDLLAFLPIHELGTDGTRHLADIWGWTDPETGTEYAIVARTDGTAFVDLSDPEHPVLLGSLPTSAGINTWRDVKVINDHAVVVADNVGDHGMQVFDLTRLREVESPPVVFEADVVYDRFGSAHNVVVNDEADYAYAVGISGPQDTPGSACGPGPHIIDMSDPANPSFAGCYNPSHGGGYTHDAQCVRYSGPDADHAGRDICLGADEVGVSITDVTDPAAPVELSLVDYPSAAYTHQGWLTEDQRYFLVDDELDETGGLVSRTRTLVFDVEDLDEPVFVGEYMGKTTASDHNLYILDSLAYEANYRAGLRILNLSASGEITPDRFEEVAYFDVFPRDDNPGFNGSWSSYPYFKSGTIVVSGIESGLFVLAPSSLPDVARDEKPDSFGETSVRVFPNPASGAASVVLTLAGSESVRIDIFDPLGRRVRRLHDGYLAAGNHTFALPATGLPGGVYFVRVQGGGVSNTVSVTLQP